MINATPNPMSKPMPAPMGNPIPPRSAASWSLRIRWEVGMGELASISLATYDVAGRGWEDPEDAVVRGGRSGNGAVAEMRRAG